MALNSLDRLKRSKATTQDEIVVRNQYKDPRYDRSLPLEARQQAAFELGYWIDPADRRELQISLELLGKEWIAHPFRAQRAADWRIAENDTRPDCYQRFALHMWNNGWSPFPEERGDGPHGRRPAIAPPKYKWRTDVYGSKGYETVLETISYSRTEEAQEKLRYHAIKTSERRDRPVDLSALVQEVEDVDARENVGIVIGPASGNIRVIDVDIVDEDLAEAVDRLIVMHLGATGFIRVGRWPKRQYIFRGDPSDEKLMNFPSTSWEVMGPDGKPDLDSDGKVRNAIEFLGYGRHMTAYGIHHKTGKCFEWIGDKHPATHGPEEAPVIGHTQFMALIEDINGTVRKLKRKGASNSNPFGNGSGEAFSFEAAPSDARVWIPKRIRGEWTTDENGIVTDGREDYLRYLSYAAGAANSHLMMNDADAAAVLKALTAYAEQTCKDGKCQGQPTGRVFAEKFRVVVGKWRASIHAFNESGEYHDRFTPFRIDPTTGNRPCQQHIKPAERPADGSLDWLPVLSSLAPELGDRSKIKNLVVLEKSTAAIRSDAEVRALIEDEAKRAVVHARVSAEVRSALVKFLEEMIAVEAEGNPDLAVHILSAPTGGGKTTMTIAELAEILKQFPRKPSQGPIIIAVPTHANAAEGLKTAARNGMTVPDSAVIQEAFGNEMAALRGAGLIVEVFAGKEKAGCKRTEELRALADRQIAATNLCGTDVDDEDEIIARKKRKEGEKVDKKEILCPFRVSGECGYWQQHARVASADIVFVPHAYLTTPQVPKVLKNPRAVFIDESVVFRLLRTVLMPTEALEAGRPEPWLIKAEKDAGMNPADQHALREIACGIALEALAAGKDVASVFYARKDGKDLIDAAIRVCKRAHTREKQIRPDQTLEVIQAIAALPKGDHLFVEARFWNLVNDSFLRITEDERMNTDRIGGRRGTCGSHDARIRVVTVPDENGQPKTAVRLSWRVMPNWADKPMMLLDASASPRIMAKVFSRRIVEHTVTAPMHVRTVAMIDSAFSNSSFIPRDDATEKQVEACAWNVERARRLIMKMAAIYSYGPVIVGMTKAVRQAIFTPDWMAPPNVTALHFGALRGLDYAKNAVAALSIGRSEMPIWLVDGYVAALSYDDQTPEQPYDVLGTGLDAEGRPLMRKGIERKIKMRTGEDWAHYVPTMPSAMMPKSGIGPAMPLWSGEIESQWREEELRQFLGRLRPVYRAGEAPVWVCMSKCLPEDIIVDDIVALDDVIADHDVWSVMALSGGILADGVTERLPGVRKIIGDKPVSQFVAEMLGSDVAHIAKIGQGMAKVRYQLETGGPIMSGCIAAWWRDPETEFRNACAAVGVEPAMVEVTKQERDFVDLQAHNPDKLTVSLEEARQEKQQAAEDWFYKAYAERVHRLLPPEESLSVEQLEAMARAGQDLEGLLVGWLHSWRDDRDVVSIDDTWAMWEELKAAGSAAIDEAFGVAGCVAAE